MHRREILPTLQTTPAEAHIQTHTNTHTTTTTIIQERLQAVFIPIPIIPIPTAITRLYIPSASSIKHIHITQSATHTHPHTPYSRVLSSPFITSATNVIKASVISLPQDTAQSRHIPTLLHSHIRKEMNVQGGTFIIIHVSALVFYVLFLLMEGN